jgi:hypothetical protein
MSDWIPDSEVVILPDCPGCQPERDPREYVVRHCVIHDPSTRGSEDERVMQTYVNGTSEAGGDDNRRFCDWLHRKRTLLRGQ